MSRPQTYRDVCLPDEWEDYPDDAKVNFLANCMDREALLQRVAEAADIPESEVGPQSIHKAGLAQLVVVLEGVSDDE